MFKKDEALKSVVDLIITKIEPHKKDQGSTCMIGFFSDDFKACDLTQEIFFSLLTHLAENDLIENIDITDEDGWKEADGTFFSWNAYPQAFPGIYTIEVRKDFDKRFPEKFASLQRNKIVIIVDLEEGGIFREEKGRRLSYEISGKRASLVNLIIEGNKIGKILTKKGNYSDIQTLSKEIREINEYFKEKLHLEYGLIVNYKGSGYHLNTEMYDIRPK